MLLITALFRRGVLIKLTSRSRHRIQNTFQPVIEDINVKKMTAKRNVKYPKTLHETKLKSK